MYLKKVYHWFLKRHHNNNMRREAKKQFEEDKKEYIRQNDALTENVFTYSKEHEFPCLRDKNTYMQPDSHYFLQDIVMANHVIQERPQIQYDVASSTNYIAHLLAADIQVTQIDVRPFVIDIPNLHFVQGNATDLSNIDSDSISSLSSLHALEHFGLGRYGDPIDPEGWKKALLHFQRILKKGGKLYLSVPIGPHNKLCFNAHRIFHPKTIVETLDLLTLEHFSYIKDYRIYDADPLDYTENADYLCGLFIFYK